MRDLTWSIKRFVARLRAWRSRRANTTARTSAEQRLKLRQDRALALYNIDRSRWN